jgi:hypothetical protein
VFRLALSVTAFVEQAFLHASALSRAHGLNVHKMQQTSVRLTTVTHTVQILQMLTTAQLVHSLTASTWAALAFASLSAKELTTTLTVALALSVFVLTNQSFT